MWPSCRPWDNSPSTSEAQNAARDRLWQNVRALGQRNFWQTTEIAERRRKSRKNPTASPRSAGIYLSAPSPRAALPTHGWGKQSVWLAAGGSQTLFCGLMPTPTDRRGRRAPPCFRLWAAVCGFPSRGGETTAPRATNAVWDCVRHVRKGWFHGVKGQSDQLK